ncbi:serpin family protein [Halopiger xanaduensis]|uniref:Proteinase inhibitor I4 serpin n=1 Tax=Halopiger xanaduensis (strain DSM 18323 / JCM 14033 / SH-6) TaxID=797210 RepID=F8D538_HALXS|nr:serpin family protein [Halopiger xanaduensis]AEH36390.1 proteinase inhibitor I4 serpin [Halopiger xanaduensis SH-6]
MTDRKQESGAIRHGRRRLLTLSGALLAGVAGCTGSQQPDGSQSNGTAADEDAAFEEYAVPSFPQPNPVTDLEIERDSFAEQVRGNVAFSFDLLARLRATTPDENLFFSPYSVSVALAMTYGGARDETATEMADALHYELEGESLHGAFGSLEAELEQRNEDGRTVETAGQTDEENEEDEDDLGFQISSANAVWPDESFQLDEAYVDLLEAHYGSGQHRVDFSGSPDEARREINGWVEERTNDRIEDLLSASAVNRTTRLVLTNAVYFRAAWEHDFASASTEPAPFAGIDGSETEVEMMHQTTELPYAEIGGHQLVELPYANDDTSMVVILPAEGEFESFEESLTTDRLATMLEETSRPRVDLTMPKFGIESKFELAAEMKKLGMERAFGRDADFSGMVESDGSGLSIDEIVHQSFIEVDEDGTEASAATAVVMGTDGSGGGPADRVEMTVDRPFLFYIRDRPTETPLFVGRIVDGKTL